MAVIVGEPPDATSRREEAIPFVGGELAAVETTNGGVEDLQSEIVLPLGEILKAAVIEVLHPVGVIDDSEPTGFVDGVDNRLAILDGLDKCFGADVQQMGAVARHFVAGKQDQTSIINFGVILAFGDDIMIADHEKIVSRLGVFIDDVLEGRFAITRRGMRVEITAQ